MTSDTPRTDSHMELREEFEGCDPDFTRKLERELNAASAEIEAMREAIKEALAVLLELEYEGNEKGTRCISCGHHCCEPHADDCVMHQAISKTKPFIKP